MVLWFAGLSLLLVWVIFRDPSIDYRLVLLGAVAPDLVEVPLGGPRLLHTLAGSVVLLVAVMVLTRGHRHLRRQLLALPVATFLHLILDGVWARTEVFWWPVFGEDLPGEGVPSVGRPPVLLVAQELAGTAALAWCWRRFRLGDPRRLRRFLRTGHLGRDLLA